MNEPDNILFPLNSRQVNLIITAIKGFVLTSVAVFGDHPNKTDKQYVLNALDQYEPLIEHIEDTIQTALTTHADNQLRQEIANN